MRQLAKTLVSIIAVVAISTQAFGQATTQVAKPAQQSTNQNVLDELLARWEERSRTRKTLNVSFKRTDNFSAWTDNFSAWRNHVLYEGQAYLQAPNLACLHFQKLDVTPGEKPNRFDFERIVCTDKEVLVYDYETLTTLRIAIDEAGRTKSLFNPQIPFLVNLSFLLHVKASELKEHYELSLVGQTKTSYLLKLVPKLETERRWYRSLSIQLDRTSLLPDRLTLVCENPRDTQDWIFDLKELDGKIDPRFFAHVSLKGWKELEISNLDGFLNLTDGLKALEAKLQVFGGRKPQ